ncbi:MAG: hypothetical protein ACKOWF_11545 [Chloroflexota bacterium]
MTRAGAALAIAGLLAMPGLAVPGPVSAELVVRRQGTVGHAGLADIQDSPGAICVFSVPGPGSIGETEVRVNPPVVFAADVTPGLDRQPVGWRASIFALDPANSDWTLAAEGPVAAAHATDQTATYFDGAPWTHAFLLTSGVYRVSVEMLWYDPEEPALVTGALLATVERYALLVQGRGGSMPAGVHPICQLPDSHAPAPGAAPPRAGA